MPSYDFSCSSCGSSFEVRLSISAYEAGEGRRCTECGSPDVSRTFTAVNVIAGSRSSGGSAWPGTSAAASSCGPSGFT